MHISEGVLSLSVLAGGGVMTALGTILGLRKINSDNIPKIAVLTATFFVASFIHVNIGPSSVHFMLNGLLALLLGWASFPVVLIGLVIQAVLFQFGGFTTLGINTLNVAGSGVFFAFLFSRMTFSDNVVKSSLGAFLTGACALGGTALLVYTSLYLTNPVQYKNIGLAVVFAHIPIMLAEGFLCLLCVRFFKKIKPELLCSNLSFFNQNAKNS